MARTIVQKGEGTTRKLVVTYHLGGAGAGVAPDVSIVSFMGTPFKQQYRRLLTQGGIVVPLLELISQLEQQLACSFSEVILAGWSEGCQGVRTHLLEGAAVRQRISGILALDGIHGDLNHRGPKFGEPWPPQWQIEPWEWAADRARAEDLAFTWTYSGIVPPNYISTRAMAEHVLGRELPKDGTTSDGWLRTLGTSGGNEAAHSAHAAMMKAELARELELLRGGTSRAPAVVAGAFVGSVALAGIAHLLGRPEWFAPAAICGAIGGAVAARKRGTST